MAKGLWINDKTFMPFKHDKRTLSAEIATRQRSIDFYALGMYLPNPDPVLKKMGKDITVYNELLADGHLGGCATSREAGVKSLEWMIDRDKAPSRQTKVVTDALKALDIDRILSEILKAPLFGYSPLEVLWERVGDYVLPKDIVGKPHEWFVFSDENELRFRTRENWNGEPLPPKKFLLARHKATYQNPYGFAELSRCFWPLTFKKGGFKFWVTFTEKYGTPFLIGKVPRGTQKSEIDALADTLEEMIQDAIAVVPDDSSVEMLVAQGKGASAAIFKDLIEACKAEVSIAILGQNLTTEVKGGSYAAAQSHMEVRKDITDSDKKMAERVFNELIGWIWEYNFAAGEKPVFSMFEQEDVDKTLAERDQILTNAGVKFSKKYFMKGYGFEEEDIEEVNSQQSAVSDKNAQFAEALRKLFPGQEAVDDALASITNEQLQEQMEGVLKPVIKLFQEGSSYEEVMENLVKTFPKMDTIALQEMLERAIFVNEIWGRLSAKSEEPRA